MVNYDERRRNPGWKSKDTLNKARQELVDGGLILLTRQGGLHRCSLYAVTFFAVDACDGKLDIGATRAPPGGWRKALQIKAASTPVVLVAGPIGTPAVL